MTVSAVEFRHPPSPYDGDTSPEDGRGGMHVSLPSPVFGRGVAVIRDGGGVT